MARRLLLRGVTRRFPGSSRPSLAALDLEVSAGETLCLVGPSGCGKSTTLRLIAGLELPDAGSIELGGRRLDGVPPQQRDVAMVFQGFALYPHMTVLQILEFPLQLRGMARAERRRRAEEVAELLGLTALLQRRPPQLSGGEQQRVAMGRAIVRRPALFLFDEPLSNLDAALRAELRGELARLLAELGTTALYVTHDQTEAMTLGHRVAVLRAGELEQLGTPREIYGSPASTFVAGFFGSPAMNLLPVEAGCAAGVPVDPPSAGLLVGVRPEHVLLGQGPGRATVRSLELHGADTYLELEVGRQKLRARLGGMSELRPGQPVSFEFSAERRWFDAETGRAR